MARGLRQGLASDMAWMKKGLCATFALVAFFMLAAPAFGATKVEVVNGVLRVVDETESLNEDSDSTYDSWIGIWRSGGDYVVYEQVQRLVVGAGCTGSGATATCTGVTSIRVETRYGNNVVATASTGESAVTIGMQIFGSWNGGSDSLSGGAGDDAIYGYDGDDAIYGNGGNDLLSAGEGTDTAHGNDGNDAMRGGDGNDTLHGGAGDDAVEGWGQSEWGPMPTDFGADVVYGGAGNDTLLDVATGEEGGNDDDQYDGGDGIDSITYETPWPCTDYYPYTRSDCSVDVSLDGVANDGFSLFDFVIERDNVSPTFENVATGHFADTIVGNEASNVLEGGAGTDTIEGGEGADVLRGGDGADTLKGDADTDSLFGEGDDDILDGGFQDDDMAGGAGSDTVDYTGHEPVPCTGNLCPVDPRGPGVEVSLDDVANDGNYGNDSPLGGGRFSPLPAADNVRPDVEVVIGSGGPDTLTGNASANDLRGAAGNDTLAGAAGPDALAGGDGNDTVGGGDDSDALSGGGGDDALTGGGAVDTFTAGAGRDQIASRDGNAESIVCGEDTDSVTADPADSTAADCETVDRGSVTLTVTKAGTGSGTVTGDQVNCGSDCTGTYVHGTAVTLTATPATGSTFAGWSGDCTGTGTCTVTMNAAKSVTATFTLGARSLAVTRPGNGGGTVTSSDGKIDCGSTCSATYDFGSSATLTATAAPGSSFAGWSGGGCSGTASSCTVTLATDTTVAATFALNTYALNVTKAGTGSGTVASGDGKIDCGSNCSDPYTHGSSATLTARAAAGSAFAGWGGACSGTQSTCTVEMTGARDVTATFTAAAEPSPGPLLPPGCTIGGTEAGETIQGTAGDDIICALGGNDTVYGLGGNDRLIGGAGNDLLVGGEGGDTLLGEFGDDRLDGGGGGDVVIGSDGIDRLVGGAGGDKLQGGAANDVLAGGADGDRLDGDAGSDELTGGGGSDTLNGFAGADTIYARDGVRDTINGGAGRDRAQVDRVDRMRLVEKRI